MLRPSRWRPYSPPLTIRGVSRTTTDVTDRAKLCPQALARTQVTAISVAQTTSSSATALRLTIASGHSILPKLMADTPNFYSIVVPARNEEATIGDVLRSVRDMTDDLIVVDGRSTDRTVSIAREYGARIIVDNGKGKGEAVRLGLAAARRPITVFIDADGSHDPGDIQKLVNPIVIGEAELVMGSRMLGGSDELFGTISEVTRLLGSLVISLSINYRYGVRLTDYQNGFRAIRTDVGRAIGLTARITTIEQEMATKCLSCGYRVTERPTHEYRRKGGVSKIVVMRAAHIYVWNLLTGILRRRRRAPILPPLESSQNVTTTIQLR